MNAMIPEPKFWAVACSLMVAIVVQFYFCMGLMKSSRAVGWSRGYEAGMRLITDLAVEKGFAHYRFEEDHTAVVWHDELTDSKGE